MAFRVDKVSGGDVFRHQFYDDRSLYAEVKRTKRNIGLPMPIREEEPPAEMVTGFLEGVRNQFPNSRIDSLRLLNITSTSITISHKYISIVVDGITSGTK